MKKTTVFLLIALLLTIIVVLLFTLTKKQTYEVRIGLSFNRTLEQLQDSSKRVAWFRQPASQDPPISIESVGKNPLITSLLFSNGKKRQLFNWMASPEPGNEYFTLLRLQYKSSWWDYLRGGNAFEKLAIENTDRLETFTKDIRAFYGYEIRTTTVQDSTLLYGSLFSTAAKRPENTVHLFDELMQYAEQYKLEFNGTSICNFEKYPGDSLLIKASIGIRNPVGIPEKSPYQLKRMPYGKNLLELDYAGPFGGIPKGYRTLEQFRDDHNFKSMAIPYQEYPDPKQAYTDSQQVTLRLYYPVF